jgi:hypothetical protein
VTGIACCGGRDVERRLARCGHAVMAGRANADGNGVCVYRPEECRVIGRVALGMAGIACCRGENVRRWFSQCINAVMAGGTNAGRSGVCKCSAQECRVIARVGLRVTSVACSGCRYVNCRLSRRGNAVMAGGTDARWDSMYGRPQKCHIIPGVCRGVARVALCRSRYVMRRLARDTRALSGMTTGTVSRRQRRHPTGMVVIPADE